MYNSLSSFCFSLYVATIAVKRALWGLARIWFGQNVCFENLDPILDATCEAFGIKFATQSIINPRFIVSTLIILLPRKFFRRLVSLLGNHLASNKTTLLLVFVALSGNLGLFLVVFLFVIKKIFNLVPSPLLSSFNPLR